MLDMPDGMTLIKEFYFEIKHIKGKEKKGGKCTHLEC
jgi:hypothetical protein